LVPCDNLAASEGVACGAKRPRNPERHGHQSRRAPWRSTSAPFFDYYFADTSRAAEEHHCQSIAVSEKVQDEDMAICDAVQRGLGSRAYIAGRLSVRREAGEHLFHSLLHADLTAAIGRPAAAD